MIKYEGTEKRFYYDIEDVNRIINILSNVKYENPDICSKEEVYSLVEEISSFISNFKVVEKSAILERKENEEEAREYFGEEFINKFENVLSIIDQQHTMLALHGTSPEVCPLICEEGLKYKSPSLDSTADTKNLNFGDGNVHYENYKELVNWGHKNYKGLVMIAVPYECYYREGLWEHYEETENKIYGSQDYKIPSDFIVGYIDVEKKNIILNSKYNRNHNYSNLEKDNDIYKNLTVKNDEEMIQEMKQKYSQISTMPVSSEQGDEMEEINLESTLFKIEEFVGLFNSMTIDYENGLHEERYKMLLMEISRLVSEVSKAIPLMKTQEEILAEQTRFSMFDAPSINSDISNQISDFGDDIDWGFPSLEEENTQIKR